MFDTRLPDEATADLAAQLPQTQPRLTPAARARIESELRERQTDLLAGLQRHERALAQMEAGVLPADAERMAHTCQMLALLEGELSQTTTALRRLSEGTYGVCERCGAPIPLHRLQIVPSALRCGACTPH